MRYVLVIYHGARLTTPLAEDEQKGVHGEWAAVNKTPGFASGSRWGFPRTPPPCGSGTARR